MHPHDYITRKEASDFLKERGLPVAPTTLAKYASLGGGPPMHHFGRRVLYNPATLLDWANSKLSGPSQSTSDRNSSEDRVMTKTPASQATPRKVLTASTCSPALAMGRREGDRS